MIILHTLTKLIKHCQNTKCLMRIVPLLLFFADSRSLLRNWNFRIFVLDLINFFQVRFKNFQGAISPFLWKDLSDLVEQLFDFDFWGVIRVLSNFGQGAHQTFSMDTSRPDRGANCWIWAGSHCKLLGWAWCSFMQSWSFGLTGFFWQEVLYLFLLWDLLYFLANLIYLLLLIVGLEMLKAYVSKHYYLFL